MVRVVWVGGGLLAASMGCSALSLGAAQGQALIGRPLDVSIPLALGEGESVTDACATAQVFFANDAVSAAGVKTVVTSTQANTAAVRVQTTSPVTETFARIELQVGCGQRITRSYVLLADLAPAAAVPASPVATSKVVLPTAAAPAPAAVVVVRTSDTQPTTSTAPARPAQPAAAPNKSRKPKAPVEPTNTPAKAPVAAPAPQGARLMLDPIELVAAANQMQPSLRLSVDAPVESVENADLAQRRQAARLLWKALNDSPDQLAANALKAEVTGAEATRAKAELAQAQQLAQAAQAQLLEEQDSRYTNPLFLGVLTALVVALGGLAMVLRRKRHEDGLQEPPWWKNQSVLHADDGAVAPRAKAKTSLFSRIKNSVKVSKKPSAGLRGEPSLDIDVDTLMPEDALPVPRAPAPLSRARDAGPSQSHTDFTHSALLDGARSVATEELFDLQQQVEFFISLGQADQAVEVLKAHLSDGGDASPLAYLDLLKLYHELGRREDYAALQGQFNLLFNGNAPEFDRYSSSRRGLERYESALSRIQSLWPQPAVLQLIERSIFRNTPGDTSEVFDLEAYRELLLLYGIARDVIEGHATDLSLPPTVAEPMRPPPETSRSSARETTMQPLSMAMAPVLAGLSQDVESDDSWVHTVDDVDDGPTLAPEEAVLNSTDVFNGVGLDLDLDLSLNDEPVQRFATPDVTNAVLPSAAAALSNQPASAQSPAAPAAAIGHVLDLDFSGLGESETFTIKKSGKPG